MNRLTRYALGLLVEEMGEALVAIGRALRFGLDTPEADGQHTREKLAFELGDVKAAINYAETASVVDDLALEGRREIKWRILLSPDKRDNLGRRLAPDPRLPSDDAAAIKEIIARRTGIDGAAAWAIAEDIAAL